MPLRPIRLPADLESIVNLIAHGFQYPDNPTWSFQADQMENIVSLMKSAQRLWPLIWIAQQVSAHWRDYLCGYLWEDDRQPAGVIAFSRQGAGWFIPYLAVLPDYRRRGIARQLVHATLDYIQTRGGKSVVLEVLAGNLPAYALFKQMGFTRYSGFTEYFHDSPELPAECPLPEDYVIRPLSPSDWHVQYDLDRQIIPVEVQKYEPVEPSRYHAQISVRRVTALIAKASGVQSERLVICTAVDGQAVAYGMHAVRKRAGGINTLTMKLDPKHERLAAFLVRHLIRNVQLKSPGRRIEFILPEWQRDLMKAVQDLGCSQSVPYYQLGLLL